MDFARLAGLLLVSLAALTQQQSVEITSEPSHHLVMENAYVRVFDVTVAPKASTLVHRHNNDYVFVTLGDSDVISARPGEKPAALLLKDGEVRYTPGKFAHAAINQSDKPFHNITIELLKPTTGVKPCPQSCQVPCQDAGGAACAVNIERLIASDQWFSFAYTVNAGEKFLGSETGPTLLVAVSNIEDINGVAARYLWLPAQTTFTVSAAHEGTGKFIALVFQPEKQ